jgi:hypothetical protein
LILSVYAYSIKQEFNMSNKYKDQHVKRTKPVIAILFLGLFLAQASHAAFVARDAAGWGEGSLTLDTDTGLQWLDVNLSVSFSYNEMRAEMLSGGQYEGFRYATRDEVASLFVNAGVQHINAVSTDNNQAAAQLMEFLGFTSSRRGNNELFGITGTEQSGGVSAGVIDHLFENGLSAYDIGVADLIYGKGYKAATVGSWLVTTAEVPVPPALLLFSSALLLSGSLKRRNGRRR